MIERNKRKQIEWAFYNYPAMKQQGAEYLVELAEQGITAKYEGVGVHSSGVSNPTEIKGMKVAERSAAQWCKVVENTRKYFEQERMKTNVKKDVLIDLRYAQKLKEKEICYSLSIERETMYRWLNEILGVAFVLAVQYNLMTLDFDQKKYDTKID